jgi:hypothetical protein
MLYTPPHFVFFLAVLLSTCACWRRAPGYRYVNAHLAGTVYAFAEPAVGGAGFVQHLKDFWFGKWDVEVRDQNPNAPRTYVLLVCSPLHPPNIYIYIYIFKCGNYFMYERREKVREAVWRNAHNQRLALVKTCVDYSACVCLVQRCEPTTCAATSARAAPPSRFGRTCASGKCAGQAAA